MRKELPPAILALAIVLKPLGNRRLCLFDTTKKAKKEAYCSQQYTLDVDFT